MKKTIALILTTVLFLSQLLPALAEEETYDLDVSKLMDQWVYIDSTAVMTPMGQIKEGETAKVYPCYGLMNVVYCAHPESARIQHLDIYVPTEYVKEARIPRRSSIRTQSTVTRKAIPSPWAPKPRASI